MKTLYLGMIVGILMLVNCIMPIHADLSNPLASVTNDECVNKIMDSQELKSKVAGYQYSFDHTYKYFIIDDQACNATWRYVEVVFNLQNSHGDILSQIIVTEDVQLTKVITSDVQAYSSSNVQMTSPTASYMVPSTESDSTVVLVVILTVFAITGFLITYFSKRSEAKTLSVISAARIFFTVFSMIFLISMVLISINTIHHDQSYESIFSIIGNIFFIVENPNLYTTDSALAYFGNIDGSLRHVVDIVVVA